MVRDKVRWGEGLGARAGGKYHVLHVVWGAAKARVDITCIYSTPCANVLLI